MKFLFVIHLKKTLQVLGVLCMSLAIIFSALYADSIETVVNYQVGRFLYGGNYVSDITYTNNIGDGAYLDSTYVFASLASVFLIAGIVIPEYKKVEESDKNIDEKID